MMNIWWNIFSMVWDVSSWRLPTVQK